MPSDSIVVNLNIFKQNSIGFFSGSKHTTVYHMTFQCMKEAFDYSKAVGFYPEALDHVARQGYGNASFEVGGEEGLDIVEEFYSDESKTEQHQQTHDLTHVQDIQKGLQQNVQAVN